MWKEQGLINQIQKVSQTIKVYGRYCNDFEIWIICNDKDYSILEQASHIINAYSVTNNQNVNCVFVASWQVTDLPTFAYTSNTEN